MRLLLYKCRLTMLFLLEILACSGCDKYGRSNCGITLAGEKNLVALLCPSRINWRGGQTQASAVKREGRIMSNVLWTRSLFSLSFVWSSAAGSSCAAGVRCADAKAPHHRPSRDAAHLIKCHCQHTQLRVFRCHCPATSVEVVLLLMCLYPLSAVLFK